MVDKRGFWIQPLHPIHCDHCYWIGSGRYANRSTVCRFCRRVTKKLIESTNTTDKWFYQDKFNKRLNKYLEK